MTLSFLLWYVCPGYGVRSPWGWGFGKYCFAVLFSVMSLYGPSSAGEVLWIISSFMSVCSEQQLAVCPGMQAGAGQELTARRCYEQHCGTRGPAQPCGSTVLQDGPAFPAAQRCVCVPVWSQTAAAADNTFLIGSCLSSSISYIMMGILWLCFSYQFVLLFLDSISSSAQHTLSTLSTHSGSRSFAFLFSFFSCFLLRISPTWAVYQHYLTFTEGAL